MAAVFASAVVPLRSARAPAPARRSVLARDANTGGQINQPGGKKMWLPGSENPPYLGAFCRLREPPAAYPSALSSPVPLTSHPPQTALSRVSTGRERRSAAERAAKRPPG